MKKKVIIGGIIFLGLIILIYAFILLSLNHSPLVSKQQPLGEAGDMSNIDVIGSIEVDNKNIDIKIGAIKDNQVVNEIGQPTKNNLEPKAFNAPSVSLNFKNAAKISIPNETIKLVVSKESITPDSFVVKSGQPITILVESTDEWYHTIRFIDSSLSSVVIGVAGGEERLIRFNAPSSTGEYLMYDEMFGVEGKMIVQ
jgi:hypothetical protein